MQPSNPSSLQAPNNNRNIHKGWAVAVLVIALIGFADASYLTIEHYKNVIPPCTTNGCETVLTSAYSTVAGIPISLFGAIYYLAIAIGAFAYIEGKRHKIFKAALILPVIGFIVSLGLVSIMAFVVHSWCQYCLASAAISTVLFVLSLLIWRSLRSPQLQSDEQQVL
jgi:uncharacterized membrane protein